MPETSKEKVVRTVCQITDTGSCGILAHVRDGVMVKVEPADFSDPKYRHICAKGLCATKLVYHRDRLKHPLKRVGERGEGKWQRISWDEAYDIIVGKLKEIGAKYGSESVAWTTGMGTLSMLNLPIYLRFASVCGATWVRLTGYGDAAGPCGDKVSCGVLQAEPYVSHFDRPELCVVWGSNCALTQPFRWRRIRDAKAQGAKVIVIDPRFTETAAKADEYIPIRPGTDTALVLGIMNVILAQNLHDSDFITAHTVGPFLVRSDNGLFLREKDVLPGGAHTYMVWDSKAARPRPYNVPEVLPALTGAYVIGGIECKPAFQLLAELVARYSPEKVSEITEIKADVIRKLAVEYGTCNPVASYRGWGLQRTFHGHLSHRAVTCLAAITGNINLQGPRDFVLNMGALTRPDGRSHKRMPLLRLYDALLTDKPYPIRALWVAGNNLINQIPNTNKVIEELLPRLEFIVVADIFMTPTAEYADIVLPVCTFFERMDLLPPTDYAHPYLQLQQKVIEPLAESKSDLEIVTGLARRMGFGNYFNKNEEEFIEMLLSSGHPSVEGVTLERLKQGPIPVPPHVLPEFRTPSDRLEFYSESMKKFGQELPIYIEPLESARQALAGKYPLSYVQGHSKYRSHSMLDNVSWLRELDPQPMLEINPVDAAKRGIHDGDLVVAFNDRGRVKLKAKLHDGLRPGLVNISQGWWPGHYVEGSHQALTHETVNQVQQAIHDPNTAMFDNLVEVQKAEGD